MKNINYLLLAVILVLPCCIATKTTHPDGTVTETKSLDKEAIRESGKFVNDVAPWFSSK